MAWIIVVEPLIKAGGDSALALYISARLPARRRGDRDHRASTCWPCSASAARPARHLALVGAGIVAFAVSDIGYAYLNLIGAYASGGVTDIGWFAGFSLILLAARKPIRRPPATPRPSRATTAASRSACCCRTWRCSPRC